MHDYWTDYILVTIFDFLSLHKTNIKTNPGRQSSLYVATHPKH